jgi:NADH-quinone oxidoreductase subunit J
MNIQLGLFYFFAAIVVFAALRVITARNPVHAVLYLVLTFFTSAALWMLMEAEFLAIVLVLVYVGAVMVLFLFVVMMLDINIAVMREGFARYLPLAGAVAGLMLLEMLLVLNASKFRATEPLPAPADYSNTQALGEQLYLHFIYPFEIAGAILLVAIVAAIALTLRRRADIKHQSVDQQLSASRTGRVRLVNLPSSRS